MDFMTWVSATGTNEWIKGLWANNWIIISLVAAPVGAYFKGKHPDFWSKLSTALPFIGNPGRKI